MSHKHVTVNGHTVNIPSFAVKPGDVIALRPKSRDLEVVSTSLAVNAPRNKYKWVEVDAKMRTGKFLYEPTMEEIPENINVQLIVDFIPSNFKIYHIMSNYSIQMPESLDVVKDEDSFGTFVLQPLERGFGVTIGNSFRRVLLSSLPGIAITAIKINGVDHEYSSIKGVKEDVYEIILNFKQVRFKQIEQSGGVIHITKKGAGALTAADIDEATAEYDILNNDLIIANLADDAELERIKNR